MLHMFNIFKMCPIDYLMQNLNFKLYPLYGKHGNIQECSHSYKLATNEF